MQFSPNSQTLHHSSPKELSVRLSYGLCPEEQAFLGRRKRVVAAALKQALQLDEDLKEDEVWGYSRDVDIDILGWAGLSQPSKNAVGLLGRWGSCSLWRFCSELRVDPQSALTARSLAWSQGADLRGQRAAHPHLVCISMWSRSLWLVSTLREEVCGL